MDKIQFDIKYRPEIEAGKYKVVTRDGRDVRILCWDANQFYPICAQYRLCAGTLVARYFDCNGVFEGSGETENDYDLFLVTPEPELTKFESRLAEIIDFARTKKKYAPDTEIVSDAKRLAAELLELAKAELTRQGNIVLTIEEFEKRHMEAQEAGRKKALKGLPRWVKVNEGDLLDKHSNYLLCSNGWYYYCSGNTIQRDGYMLLVDNLEKLPKEDEK